MKTIVQLNPTAPRLQDADYLLDAISSAAASGITAIYCIHPEDYAGLDARITSRIGLTTDSSLESLERAITHARMLRTLLGVSSKRRESADLVATEKAASPAHLYSVKLTSGREMNVQADIHTSSGTFTVFILRGEEAARIHTNRIEAIVTHSVPQPAAGA